MPPFFSFPFFYLVRPDIFFTQKRLARLKPDLWLADEGLLREVKCVSVKRKVEGEPFLDDSC